MRPICKTCNSNFATRGGAGKWQKECSSCKKKPWAKYKKAVCECCSFVPVNACQLDVDHIDGDKENNSIDNFQTLCANCHRLKTHLSQDYSNKEYVYDSPQLSLVD
jgi:hypothetical protein